MKKLMTGMAMLLSTLAFSGAQAQEEVYSAQPMAVEGNVYTCRMNGRLSGGSIAIGVGGQILKGKGTIVCRNNHSGEVTEQKVNLRMAGGGVGFEIARIKSVEVVTAGVGVSDPRYFFENFSVGAEAGASLIRAGISVDAAVRLAGKEGFGFDVGFQGKEILGLGAHLYAMGFRITPR